MRKRSSDSAINAADTEILPAGEAGAALGLVGTLPDLRQILAFLQRRFSVLSAITLLGTALAIIHVLQQTPLYSATTTLLVDARQTRIIESEEVLSGIGLDTWAIESELELIRSAAVGQAGGAAAWPRPGGCFDRGNGDFSTRTAEGAVPRRRTGNRTAGPHQRGGKARGDCPRRAKRSRRTTSWPVLPYRCHLYVARSCDGGPARQCNCGGISGQPAGSEIRGDAPCQRLAQFPPRCAQGKCPGCGTVRGNLQGREQTGGSQGSHPLANSRSRNSTSN